MNELERALKLANQCLDEVRDPDANIAVISRQLLRTNEKRPLVVRHESQAAHENSWVIGALVDSLLYMANDNERVIWRKPFRWHDKNGVLNNQYEMFDVDSVAKALGCEVIWDFNHAAIIRPVPAPEKAP